MTANNYEVSVRSDTEVAIQTEPHQLYANGGRVYLTYLELCQMLELLIVSAQKPEKAHLKGYDG